jgi:hypothetical protein
MPGDSTSSFAFFAGRQFVARQNVTLFEVFEDTFVSPIVDMSIMSTDLLVQPPTSPVPVRNQKIQLKDIEFGIYFPTCSPDGIVIPTQSVSDIKAIYQRYTFFLSINDNKLQYSVAFNQNAQRVRSRLWLTTFPTVINSLSMKVRRDFIDPAWIGAPVTLFSSCEFYCYAEGS